MRTAAQSRTIRRWALSLGAAAAAWGCGSGGALAPGEVSDASTGAPDASPAPDADARARATEASAADPEAAVPSGCQAPFAFADPVVEAAVRSSAKVPAGPLSMADLLRVTEVDTTGASSLGGVECLTNLQIAGFFSGTVRDIEALRGLTRLQVVSLTMNQIADLSPLTHHPRLKILSAEENLVANLNGLTLPPGGCSEFYLAGNPITASELAVPCAQGWYVSWGGTGITATDSCNLQCP